MISNLSNFTIDPVHTHVGFASSRRMELLHTERTYLLCLTPNSAGPKADAAPRHSAIRKRVLIIVEFLYYE